MSNLSLELSHNVAYTSDTLDSGFCLRIGEMVQKLHILVSGAV